MRKRKRNDLFIELISLQIDQELERIDDDSVGEAAGAAVPTGVEAAAAGAGARGDADGGRCRRAAGGREGEHTQRQQQEQ